MMYKKKLGQTNRQTNRHTGSDVELRSTSNNTNDEYNVYNTNTVDDAYNTNAANDLYNTNDVEDEV